MKEKLIPLTINRNKWARGGYNGDSMLLNTESNMCCLGFACRALGVSAKTIKQVAMPDSLANRAAQPSYTAKKLGRLVVSEDEGYGNSNPTDDAQSINDDEDISDKMREFRLKPILQKLGFAVKFVGPARDVPAVVAPDFTPCQQPR